MRMKTGGNGSTGPVPMPRFGLPPFHSSIAKARRKVSHKSELKHIGLCLLVCLPTCTTVCLIVDRLVGG